ncbi:pirin family protein [Hydrogenovibrio thermophilus]|uniref:Pirin family protein n=1 Tax=Hydrogenovibrio thermophilus TaxID=265883 RepID=A0A410H5L1_9GAMM|nr:pirin family protein [Hydrogenovibrio thermophilus]QAB16176.1 pirin family protein [Hydrogenovibrio thermophilus]
MSHTKEVTLITRGMPASDGAGVRLTRLIGNPQLKDLDPFLMLDAFESDNPDDYIAGFPPHPHRGFETVTYLLHGRMRHRDNQGNEGVVEPGGIQWMTAGRGVIHSEMPEQENGLLQGFQLWVNLPSHAKMTEPGYQDFSPEDVPVETWENGTEIRVVTGTTERGTVGPVKNDYVTPTYLDVSLTADTEFVQALESGSHSFIYLIEGRVYVGDKEAAVSQGQLAVLSDGDRVQLRASDKPARFLLISAQPLEEPIARGGPFVMNTQAELQQAFDDFRNNRF